ncbi:MAG TPA: hypothetical protein VEF05_00580 [Terriglobales bacterium]|nr:hypothetical protein [Terriglobales bacterium]
MKRISILACILAMYFVSTAWAQQPATRPHLGRHPQHGIAKLLSKAQRMAQPRSYRASAIASDASKTWDLGFYSDATTTALQSINDFGVAMGWADMPVTGGTETHMIGIPLIGFNAGQWFDTGIISGENDAGEAGAISNTGIIAGNIMDSDGSPEAYAWIPNHGGVRLGKYSDANGVDDGSIAIGINHSGTLIVGNSGKTLSDGTFRAVPLVWTSKVVWNDGRPTLSWQLHALPTGGLEKLGAVFDGIALDVWGAWGVNDSGQIAGDGWTHDASGNYWEIAVVWTPVKGGTGWRIQRLPVAAGITYNEALGINDLGEIVGDVWDSNAFPALYQQDPKTRKWFVHVLPTTSPDLDYGWSIAWSINDLGDIVGYCSDENWTGHATRWNSHDLSFAESLGFPGDTSAAYGVNNLGIAVGGYQNFVYDANGNQEFDQYGNPVLTPEEAAAARFH